MQLSVNAQSFQLLRLLGPWQGRSPRYLNPSPWWKIVRQLSFQEGNCEDPDLDAGRVATCALSQAFYPITSILHLFNVKVLSPKI